MKIDRERLRKELERMKHLIATDPEVLARFDTDGNGVIDGQEWQAVRQLVIKRLEREAMESELARKLREQLDPEQASELARMEADIAGSSDDDVRDPVHDDRAESAGLNPTREPRDFEGLELAFDPREDRAVQEHSIAEEIYEKDLGGRFTGSRNARTVRLSEAGTLADCQELILEQSGGVKQFFGSMFRRGYIVRNAAGDEVGRIGQRENEMLQNLSDYSILKDPDLNFTVDDAIAAERFQLKRTSGFADNTIAVINPNGRTIARTSWTLSFLRRKYEVRVIKEGMSYYVRRRFLKPWTFDVLDPFEESIGTMQRGWSGLGFLTGGNLFHIAIDEEISPDAMWGFLATALLADLDGEKRS